MFSGRRRQGDSLERYAATVERILQRLNIDPEHSRMTPEQSGYAWTFQRGSAIIEIYLSQQDDRGFLQVLSPIIHIPPTNILALYRRLLELNLQLTNASLGVYLDVVYVFNERPLEGLDATEADSIITRVAGYADELDNELVNEFGGRLYSQL